MTAFHSVASFVISSLSFIGWSLQAKRLREHTALAETPDALGISQPPLSPASGIHGHNTHMHTFTQLKIHFGNLDVKVWAEEPDDLAYLGKCALL